MQIHPYLSFPGTCEEAFTLYKAVLRGEITMMMTHAEAPDAQAPIEWRGKIMHAGLKVGDEMLMGSDLQAEHYKAPAGGYISLAVDSPEEAERIFTGLGEGGKVTMPLQKTFWARGFGMLTDRFGIPWMVNCE